MKTSHLKRFVTPLTLALGLCFGSVATAQALTKAEYTANGKKIGADYKMAKDACSSQSGNSKSICVTEARAKEKVEKANLESIYKPSPKNLEKAHIAKAEADYDVARERCNEKAGNTKDVCVKEAKAAETAAIADAKVQMKTTDANTKASDTKVDARNEAADDKMNAQYKVAKEKCDSFASAAKDKCMEEAKARFGK